MANAVDKVEDDTGNEPNGDRSLRNTWQHEDETNGTEACKDREYWVPWHLETIVWNILATTQWNNSE